MPKKQNAFALRDFDEKRILQRPYFKKFNFDEGLTDVEIIQSLKNKVANAESVDVMEDVLAIIKTVHEWVQRYSLLLERYGKRLNKLNRLAPTEYLTAQLELVDLEFSFRQLYHETEEKIQKAYRKVFTEKLFEYRRAAGLSQKKLGELVEVSPMGMSNYALGKNEVPLHTLARIAKVLNVSTDELLGIK